MKLKSENLSEIKTPVSLAKSLPLSEPAWGPFTVREAREAWLSGRLGCPGGLAAREVWLPGLPRAAAPRC